MNSLTTTVVTTIVTAALASAAFAGDPGQDWRFYTPANTGMPGDTVRTIFLDDQDRPWISGYITFWEQGGMARFDRDTDTWLSVTNVDYDTIVSPRFGDIVEDDNGIMWIASDHGLLRYDPAIGPDSLVRFDHTNSPLPISQLQDLSIDPTGAIWIAVHDVNDAPPGGLVRFRPDTNTWDVWTTANGLPWGGEWPGWDWVDFVAVAPDADGGFTVWFGSGPMGMATWKDGVFAWYGNGTNLPPLTPVGLPSENVVDDQGNIWMNTTSGLARRDPSGSFVVAGYPNGLGSEVSVVTALSGGRAALGTFYSDVFVWDGSWSSIGNWGGGSHTYTFAEEAEGAIWTGGLGGAARYENGSWQRYRITNTGMIGYFVDTLDFDQDDRLLVNGNAGPGIGGFNIFDGTRWIGATNASYGLGPDWNLPSDDVQAITGRANGDILAAPGGAQGLTRYNGEDFAYMIPPGYSIEIVEEDGLGRIWAAHDLSAGVFMLSELPQVLYTSGNSQLPPGTINQVVADETQPGYVWISTAFGVAHTNGIDWTLYPREVIGLDENTTSELLTMAAPDPDETLWMGSMSGLFHYDPANGTYVNYNTSNSPLPSNEVEHVTLAPDGSVWVSMFDSVWPYPGGLGHFDGTTWTIYTAAATALPHNQHQVIRTRPIPGGYELWVGTASEGLAVLTVTTNPTGDLDGDGVVDFADLLIVLAAWGTPGADLDGDGTTGIADLLIVLSSWT